VESFRDGSGGNSDFGDGGRFWSGGGEGEEFFASAPDGGVGFGDKSGSDDGAEGLGLGGEAFAGGFEEDVYLKIRDVVDGADLKSGMGEAGILNGEEDAIGFDGILRETGERGGFGRKRVDAEDGAGDDAESAERAGGELGEIVAGDIFYDFAATAGERAIGKSESDADDEVAKSAEAEAKRAAVVGGEDAADGGVFGEERIDGEALAVLREGGLQGVDGAAGFDGDGEIGPSVLNDFIQARGGENYFGAGGRIAPGEFGGAAARDDGEAGFVGGAEGVGEFAFVGGFDD